MEQPVTRLTIGVAGGVHKTEAILATLTGKLISGLITDEAVAKAILTRK
ncbi:sugar-binding domain-containing protein [Vacuolonema iberomarrocanum]